MVPLSIFKHNDWNTVGSMQDKFYLFKKNLIKKIWETYKDQTLNIPIFLVNIVRPCKKLDCFTQITNNFSKFCFL